MSIIDIIEGPIRLSVDGIFSLFEGGKKGGSRGGSRGGNSYTSRSSSSSLGNKKFGKSKISNYSREGLIKMDINAKKARKNLSGIKTTRGINSKNIFGIK